MQTSPNPSLEITPSSFVRRLGPAPQSCSGSSGCPDIWELADGDFAVIGADITNEASSKLPAIAGCAPGERIIRLPRSLLVKAKQDIPDQL
jgi:hypothetical protein